MNLMGISQHGIVAVLAAATVVLTMTSGVAAVEFNPASNWTTGLQRRVPITGRPEGQRVFDIYIAPDVVDSPSLVIYLHSTLATGGDTVGGDQRPLTGLREYADTFKNIIPVWPQGYQNSWNKGYCCNAAWDAQVDDVGFLKQLIDFIKDNVKIDARKIYLTGFSAGAALAQTFAAMAPAHVAGIGSNSFALYDFVKDFLLKNKASDFRPIPVYSIHGYHDNIECWGWFPCYVDWAYSGLLLHEPVHIHGDRGWHNWAELNGCATVGPGPITLAESDNHDDFQWIKAYQQCDDGVEVRQLLNSRSHSGEFFGTNGLLNQKDYTERVLAFLLNYAIPATVSVYEPIWWSP